MFISSIDFSLWTIIFSIEKISMLRYLVSSEKNLLNGWYFKFLCLYIEIYKYLRSWLKCFHRYFFPPQFPLPTLHIFTKTKTSKIFAMFMNFEYLLEWKCYKIIYLWNLFPFWYRMQTYPIKNWSSIRNFFHRWKYSKSL